MFALNATVPMFRLVLLGVAFGMTNILNCDFADRINHFVFNISLPIVPWRDLSGTDFLKVWNGGSIGFCFVVTTASILITAAASMLLKKKEIRGEFIQASYRSSAVLLGIASAQNIYGDSNMTPLMIIGCVPLYSITAVVTLGMMRPGRGRINKGPLIKTLAGILHNPILWGIICDMAWSASGIPQPIVLVKVIGDVTMLTTLPGLLVMGALFDLGRAGRNIGPVLSVNFIRLAGLESIIIPATITAGFRGGALAAIFIMLDSVTIFGAFVMVKNMGYNSNLTSNIVTITTCGCAVTLTIGLYISKSLSPI